jgi:acyl-CoA synthetase (AMP-forming)/AMP-acid ligase II
VQVAGAGSVAAAGEHADGLDEQFLAAGGGREHTGGDGTGGERVHAVVVLRSGATLADGELRAHVKSLIAGYKAPRSQEIVDKLPLSGTGKVLKRTLRQQHWGDQERQIH